MEFPMPPADSGSELDAGAGADRPAIGVMAGGACNEDGVGGGGSEGAVAATKGFGWCC